jgi:aspartokinase
MSTTQYSVPGNAYNLQVSSHLCLFCVERRGIGCGPDLVGRTLLCLFQHGVKLLMFSQSSASGNFCFVVSSASREIVLSALTAELYDDLQRREITCLSVQDNVALLLVLPSSACVSVSDRLATRGINILAVAQNGGSISLLIQQSDLPNAIAALGLAASAPGAREFSVITPSHETYSTGPQ